MATTRPSPRVVALGYQRAECMLARADQLLLAGSKTWVELIPTSPPLCPPITIRRPSGRPTWAEQKIWVVRLGTGVKAWVAGFQSRTDGVPPVSQASQTSTLPVLRRAPWTATRGQLRTLDHWPDWL